jgi:hypothetical protein
MLPARLLKLVTGSVAAAAHEDASVIAARAAELVTEHQKQDQGIALDAVLTEAAKGGRAVASLDEAIEAINRGAVRRLYLLAAFGQSGQICNRCSSLQLGTQRLCHSCGTEVQPVELASAMVNRVIASGGDAETVDTHAALTRVGGVAVLLRHPL